MRNYDLAAGRRETIADAVPLGSSKLPVGIAPPRVESSRVEEADSCCLDSTSSDESNMHDDEVDTLTIEAKKAVRSQRHVGPVPKLCGTLPEGLELDSFHEQPLPKTNHFTEAQY